MRELDGGKDETIAGIVDLMNQLISKKFSKHPAYYLKIYEGYFDKMFSMAQFCFKEKSLSVYTLHNAEARKDLGDFQKISNSKTLGNNKDQLYCFLY